MAIPKPKHDDERPDEERDPDQAWFWTESWQEGEGRVNEDIRKGKVESFDSMEEFLDTLDDE